MPSDSHSFDEVKLPFIFVPHGHPEPTEWLQRHLDYIKLPATFVPHAHSNGRSNPRSSSPPPGQHRSTDGPVASPDPAAPGPPVGNAQSNTVSAGTNRTPDGALTSASPIDAFRRADDALATAASDHASAGAAGWDLYANVGSRPPNRTVPSGSLTEQVGSAIWRSIVPSAEAQPVEPDPENRGLFGELFDPMADVRAANYYSTVRQIRQLDPGYTTLTSQNFIPSEVSVEAARTDLSSTRANVAGRIANGHAFDKHAAEFGVTTPGAFQSVVADVLSGPSTQVRTGLAKGRTAFYDAPSNTIVIVNPSASDSGTAFRPTGGARYFNELP